MSEEATHWRYREYDILIDAARVLDSNFPTIGVALDGSECEILRNVLNYAKRRQTFVDTYADNYYLAADDADWLEIETIIGILEAKLMGNDNTLWGYNAPLAEEGDETVEAAGTYDMNLSTVPAGEVWVVQGLTWWSDVATGAVGIFRLTTPGRFALVRSVPWDANKYNIELGVNATLTEGDNLRFEWYSLLEDQRVIGQAWGYKMKVEA